MPTHQATRYFRLTLVFVCISCALYAQDSASIAQHKKPKSRFEPSSAVMFIPNYDAQLPFGHVAQRFGFDNLISMELLYKTDKNWLVGANGGFIYGSNVKQDYVFTDIATSTGQFITQYNDLTNIRPQEQGYSIQFTFGKIIPFSERYPDAGLLLMTGFGIVQDKIAVSIRTAELPQLSPQYRRGYDRMCNGPVLSQFIGGNFMARGKYISGYAGLQVDASYTIDERPYDFYTQSRLTSDRGFDLFLGLKVGFIISKWLETSEKEFFYY